MILPLSVHQPGPFGIIYSKWYQSSLALSVSFCKRMLADLGFRTLGIKHSISEVWKQTKRVSSSNVRRRVSKSLCRPSWWRFSNVFLFSDYVGIELVSIVCNIRYQSSRLGVENSFGSSCKWGGSTAGNHCSRVRCHSNFYKFVSSNDSRESSGSRWSSSWSIRYFESYIG